MEYIEILEKINESLVNISNEIGYVDSVTILTLLLSVMAVIVSVAIVVYQLKVEKKNSSITYRIDELKKYKAKLGEYSDELFILKYSVEYKLYNFLLAEIDGYGNYNKNDGDHSELDSIRVKRKELLQNYTVKLYI